PTLLSLLPYTPLFRSRFAWGGPTAQCLHRSTCPTPSRSYTPIAGLRSDAMSASVSRHIYVYYRVVADTATAHKAVGALLRAVERSEEHTSELQSLTNL